MSGASGPIHKIHIRSLQGQEDFLQAEEVQSRTWGYSDRDVVPAGIFSVARNFGGQALGAFDGDKMVGFALTFGALEDGHAHFHSHMVAVLPEYQNRGLGRLIKLAQREDALSRGVKQIAWTYDPLQVRNAHLNISILGGIGAKYLPNLYGQTSSPLHGGIPTDRLVIEWNLDSQRVLQALNGEELQPASDAVKVEFPIAAGGSGMPIDERLAVQGGLRERLLGLFQDGYAITGFRRGTEIATYILEKP